MEEFINKELDVSSLPRLEEQSFEKLDKNYLKIILLFRSAIGVVLLGASILAASQESELIWPAVGVLGVVFIFVFTGYLGFFKKGYALREKDLSYQRGLIFHSITTVPLNRIQHSELVRGPLDRFYGLASVKVYTAGGSSSDITVPGLTLEKAESVREYVNNKIKEDVSE